MICKTQCLYLNADAASDISKYAIFTFCETFTVINSVTSILLIETPSNTVTTSIFMF